MEQKVHGEEPKVEIGGYQSPDLSLQHKCPVEVEAERCDNVHCAGRSGQESTG
jgi:hypothetical protein